MALVVIFNSLFLLLFSCTDSSRKSPSAKTKETEQFLTPPVLIIAEEDDDVDDGQRFPYLPNPYVFLGPGGDGVNHINSECASTVCGEKGCRTINISFGTICGEEKKGICDAQDECDGNGNCVDRKESFTICKESQSECDPADYCNGIDDFCPEKFTSKGIKCGPEVDEQTEPCDRKDECDGEGNCIDLVHNEAQICEAGVEEECDPLDRCDGVNKSCPLTFAMLGRECEREATNGPCDLLNQCDGIGHCIDLKHQSGDICQYAHNACQLSAQCDGTNTTCPSHLAPVGTVCGGQAQGRCDIEGNCLDQDLELVTDNCPPGTPTGPDADADTYNANCDCDDNDPQVYLGTACPGSRSCAPIICVLDMSNEPVCENQLYPVGTPCAGDPDTPCSDGTTCTISGTCGIVYFNSNTICRNATDSCDSAEYCNGSSSQCPADGFEPAGTSCESSNICLTGTCSGTDTDCDTVFADGEVISTDMCSEAEPSAFCSAGVEYCMNKDLTDETNNPKAVLAGNSSNLDEDFGVSVSIHGQYAVVGLPHYATAVGGVNLYQFSSPNDPTPTLVAFVVNPGKTPKGTGSSGDNFGQSVSIYNNRFAVGAPMADGYYDKNTSDTDCDMGSQNNDAGAVYVFRINNDNSITLEERLQGLNIGFPQDQENNCQLEVGEDDVPPTDSDLGYDVAIGENYLVAGAPHDTKSTTGFAYVYYFNGSNWVVLQQIGSSLSDGQAQFGFSVALSPDQKKLVIGAPFHDTDHDNNGNIQTFLSDGAGGVFSGPKSNITGANGGDRFGYDVSITNNLLVAGAPEYAGVGGAYLYALNEDATVGTSDVLLSPPDNSVDDQEYGTSVSLDRTHNGHSLLVSAPNYKINQDNFNYVYGYFAYYEIEQVSGTIVPSDFVLISGQSGYDYNIFDNGLEHSCLQSIQLGISVANDSNRIAISAPEFIPVETGSCSFSGSAGIANPVGAVSFQTFAY